MNYHELSAGELLAGYRSRVISPVDAVRNVLERAESSSDINAFVTIDAARALADARDSEQRWSRGAPMGSLDGVPVSLKDLLDVRGFPTRAGSRTREAAPPAREDAPVAARLREHGAIIFGKTTTSEFGLKGKGESPLTGITRNPWSLRHGSGGSSAGAAASLAAKVGPLAIGTDGGGSVRVPSAYCGVVGFKPSFGRVPTHQPAVVGAPALVCPMARNVKDVARLLNVIALTDERDPYRLPAEARDYVEALGRPIQGLRIGASATLGFAELDPHVREAFQRACELFRSLGASVVHADPSFERPAPILQTLFSARAASTLHAFSDAERALVDPEVRAVADGASGLSAVAYLEAEAARTRLAQIMAGYHVEFDLLLTPTTAAVAPLIDGQPGSASSPSEPSPFAGAFSLSRQPAISLPMGLHPSGLPMGLQIVGRHFDDALVLRAASYFEETLGDWTTTSAANRRTVTRNATHFDRL